MTEYADDMVPEAAEHWSWPLRLRFAHFFHRGRSLCERETLYEFDGEPDRIDRRLANRCPICETRRAALMRYRAGERPQE